MGASSRSDNLRTCRKAVARSARLDTAERAFFSQNWAPWAMRLPLISILAIIAAGCQQAATGPHSPSGGVSLHQRIAGLLERLKPMESHYRTARESLIRTRGEQQARLDELLRREYQDLLSSNEPVVSLMFDSTGNRELEIATRQLCRTTLTIEAVESYLAEVSPTVEHAALWLEVSPSTITPMETTLDTERLIVNLERLADDVPAIPEVADYQMAAILNERLDYLRRRSLRNGPKHIGSNRKRPGNGFSSEKS